MGVHYRDVGFSPSGFLQLKGTDRRRAHNPTLDRICSAQTFYSPDVKSSQTLTNQQ